MTSCHGYKNLPGWVLKFTVVLDGFAKIEIMNQSLFNIYRLRNAVQTAWHSGRMASRIAVLLALFLFAKTAGLLHAEVHPFHHHTDQCEIYQAMAHPASDDVYELGVVLLSPEYALRDSVVVSQLFLTSYPDFWGRAPPSLSV